MDHGDPDHRDRVAGPAEQRAGRAVDGDEAGQAGEPGGDGEDVPGDRARAVQGLTRAARAEVGAEDDIGVEDGDQRVEIPVPGGGEEGVHGPALPAGVGVGHGRSLDAAAGPAGQLPGRLRRAVHDRGDLLERYVEHVVQHKGQPFGRCEGLQHHQQRQAHGVGQHSLLLGSLGRVGADHRLGQPAAGVVLTAGLAGAEHVQADPPGHGGQPGPQVVDGRGVAAVQAQPGFLDGVVGLA